MLGERGRSLALPAAILAPSVAPATFFAIIKNSHGTCNGSYPALMGYISAPIEAAAGMLIFSILAFVPGVILAERAYSQYYGGIF